MLFPLFFSMHALVMPMMCMVKVWAWKGCRHGQGVGKGMAGTWLTLSYELGEQAMARKDGSQGAWQGMARHGKQSMGHLHLISSS